MGTITHFEDLTLWQVARRIVTDIYSHTSNLKDFGFNDQIQRAAVSIMNNIAEGFDNDGNTMFRRFLSISKGSCGEVRNMLYIAQDLNYITKTESDTLISRCSHLSIAINKLMKYLKENLSAPS